MAVRFILSFIYILASLDAAQYECPLSWTKRDKTCYIVRYDSLTWSAARRECQQSGGDLAVINNKKTLDDVAGLVNRNIWIGLNSGDGEGKFIWLEDTTNEPTQTFWKDTNAGTDLQDCVAMVNSQWVPYACDTKLGYVCQRQAEYNIAHGTVATQSSTYKGHNARRAVDGCATRHLAKLCCTHTDSDWNPWWEVDLWKMYGIGRIVIHRRYDGGCRYCRSRLGYFRLFLSNSSGTTNEKYMVYHSNKREPLPEITIDLVHSPVTARYVRIDIPNRREYLSLCEVQVFQAKDVHSKILSPNNSNCYFDSMKWNGLITYTSTGRKCQKWWLDYPHKHDYHIDSRYPEGSQIGANSYCRDPDGDGTPWCYTQDPDVRWDYCGIPQCASNTFDTNASPRYDDMTGTSSGLTVVLAIAGVIAVIAVSCIAIYTCRKKRGNNRQSALTTERAPVYHPVTLVRSNDSRGNPTYYNTTDSSNERNIEPDTRHTPSAPYGSNQGAVGDGPGVDLGGYPPPPSYNEVVSDPEKYHTATENQETQDEPL